MGVNAIPFDEDGLFEALEVLSLSEVPVGAWNLRRAFEEHGVKASEATCGRLLRALEEAGYAKPDGRRGRVITSKGLSTLEEWRKKKVRDKSQMAFLQSLRVKAPDELVDVLVARRAIEGETAALAAEKAGSQDIEALKAAIESQKKALDAGASATEQNMAFHRALAFAGGNMVLLAALDVIYQHPDVMRALEYIRASVGSKMVEDHSRILREVERGNPAGARKAMIKHMNNVIKDVDTYRREWVGPECLEESPEKSPGESSEKKPSQSQ